MSEERKATENVDAIYDAHVIYWDVLNERLRQISQEGWTPEHDDAHTGGELALAGAYYANVTARATPTTEWPWDLSWYKPTNKRRDLVKAAALIIAEIERLDRAVEADLIALRGQAAAAETFNADGVDL